MTRRLVAALLLISLAGPAFAWGAMGHRLVADLAADELTPTARRAVDRLLAGEKNPTLSGIASWADDVRANDRVLGKKSAPWHYVGIHSPTCAYQPPVDCPDGNCVAGAIDAQAAILADPRQSIEARRQALKFVVHFIGDAHQPLHANNREDKGGNVVQLRIPAPSGEKGGNLHSLWDSGLIQHAGLDEAAYHARLRALPLAVDVPSAPLPPHSGAWVEASCRLSMRDGVYPPSPYIDEAYYARWTPVVDEQLRRAGAHLAQVLNAALDR
ncbi:S1/P1 nuclease [Cognatilysobacter segetis]|uniref:S1/P1 nuclease n=1 Tax=Cognatilysobacter segetis TaxID=2492394 RepID=UPI00105ED44E|nr:S1/P1 nuclease [Lysobacter segetis]